MHNFPEQRKGPAANLASAFCSAAEFLSDGKIGGLKAGTVVIFGALIAVWIASSYVDAFLVWYLLFIGLISGPVARILICRRKGLIDYLLSTGLKLAGLGIGYWIANAFLYDPFLRALSIVIGLFVGDGIYALYRKWYR